MQYETASENLQWEDRDGDGPGAGRNARAERNPEIEEGLNKINPNRGIKEDRNRSMFSS